jgi:alpha-tubulin suppressor-like RCC1 family protein
VACGEGHTIALTSNNEVYAWGTNKSKQLGTSDSVKSNIPRRITSLEGMTVIKITSGRKHCLALTREGQVFSWGSNEFG